MRILAPGPLASAARKVGVSRWILLFLGTGWIMIGLAVLRFTHSTVPIISVVFGILVLTSAVNQAVRACITRGGWRIWHTVLAALLVVGAFLAFVDPGARFESLAIVVGICFEFIGAYDVISSLSLSPISRLQLLSGIAEVVLGFLASSSFASGVVVLVGYVSALAMFRGLAEIGVAFTVRKLAVR